VTLFFVIFPYAIPYRPATSADFNPPEKIIPKRLW
jgi:hypothetical protein